MKPLALVTGASGKLGQKIAAWLAQQGYALVLHGFRKKPETINTGDQILTADFANTDGLRPVYERLARGDISLLINAASVFERNEFALLEYEELTQTFAINVHAPVLLMQAMARGLRESGLREGQIIHLLDAKIECTHSAWAAYTLSRKALAAAAGMAAVEYAGLLRVNAIAPRLITTETTAGESETVAELLACLKRIMDFPQLNAACLFLDGRIRLLAALAGMR